VERLTIGQGWVVRVAAAVVFLCGIFLAGAAAAAATAHQNPTDDVVLWIALAVVCGLGGTLIAVAAWRCRAELVGERLTIRNFLRSPSIVPLDQMDLAFFETRREGFRKVRMLYVVVDGHTLKIVASHSQSNQARAKFAAALSEAEAAARQHRAMEDDGFDALDHQLITWILHVLLMTRGKPARSREVLMPAVARYRRRGRTLQTHIHEAWRIDWMCVFRDGGQVVDFDEPRYTETIEWLKSQSDRTLREVAHLLPRFRSDGPHGVP
jgi:hypothetical protein